MMKISGVLPLFLLLCAARPGLLAQEISPAAAQAADAAQVRDKLATSLFFRGELADRIIEAGQAGRFVDLEGVETHSGARSLLLTWIRRNPEKAAEVYLGLKGSGGRIHDAIETRQADWKFNPAFIASIKALNAAAGSASVSREAMELAARRLYEGPQADAAEAVRLGSGRGSAGGKTYSGSYADYRLNKAGLQRELQLAGAWLEAARQEGARLELEGAYPAALALYRDFVVAASALKGREVMTGDESLRLEDLRLRLRAALAVLSLRARSAALREAAAALAGSAAPGSEELRAALEALRAEFEASAASAAAGPGDLGALARLVNGAEGRFAGAYLAYTAYDGLLSLRRASAPGFSCLADYAAYRYLAAFFPGSPYPAARARLAAAPALDAALARAGAGDLAGALEGLDPAGLEAAAASVRGASALNRAAQFFSWGLLFRPLELRAVPGQAGTKFTPVFTFFEVARGR